MTGVLSICRLQSFMISENVEIKITSSSRILITLQRKITIIIHQKSPILCNTLSRGENASTLIVLILRVISQRTKNLISHPNEI